MHAERVTAKQVWIAGLWPLEPPGPPAWSPRDAAWTIGRYADIQSVLQCDDFSAPDASSIRRTAARVGFDASALVALLDGASLFQNGKAQGVVRDVVTAVMPRLMARWTRERIDGLARQLIDELAGDPATDLVDGLVDALPNAIAADMLGLSTHDVRWLRDCAAEIMTRWRPVTPLREYERLEHIAQEVYHFLRRCPRESSRIEWPQIAAEASVANEFWFATATVATASGTLGGAISMLTKLPDLQDVLRSQPDRIPGFVDEALRLTGGARRLSRRLALRPFEIGGAIIPQGAAVILDIEHAGRDPSAYPEPETIDLERVAPPTLAFGGGQHPCMGPRLARTELTSAIEHLLAQYMLSPAGEPTFLPNPDLRQFSTLPVHLERR
jgi:cytochrome P450